MGRILIVGVGNTIMGDDGLGVHALNALRSRQLPEHVDTLEAGTALLDALPDLKQYDKIILLDAIESDNDDVAVIRDPYDSGTFNRGFSLHDIGIEDALRLILLDNGSLPEVVIMGIKPVRVEFRTDLSDNATAKVPDLVNAVLSEINCKQPCGMMVD